MKTTRYERWMKLRYFPETDTLYIDLRDELAVESDKIAHDVVVDYNANGTVVGIGIDLASTKVDLATMEIVGLPSVHVVSLPRSHADVTPVEA